MKDEEREERSLACAAEVERVAVVSDDFDGTENPELHPRWVSERRRRCQPKHIYPPFG